MTGAFWAKLGERGISRDPRGPHEPPSSRGFAAFASLASQLACGAAELRIAYGIDIVHYRTEGLKCLQLRLLKTRYLHSGITVFNWHISHNTPCLPPKLFFKSSLYTDVVLFFFSIFSKTSASSRACENERGARERTSNRRARERGARERTFPTPTPLRWRSVKYFITSARLYYE